MAWASLLAKIRHLGYVCELKFLREKKGLKSNYKSILLFKPFSSLSPPPKPQLINTPLLSNKNKFSTKWKELNIY